MKVLLLKIKLAYQRLLLRLGLSKPGKIMYICGTETLPPPLSADEEAFLMGQLMTELESPPDDMLDNPCDAVRRVLIERNLRLVVYIARRFENTGINVEDLISIGTIGLIKAINTYRPDKNIKLATYASRCIENEILMHLRKNTGIRSEVSFDEPLNTDWDGNELLLSDILGTEADCILRPIEEDVDKELLHKAIQRLSAREKEIIVMRFGLNGANEKTQKEVADFMGISQSYISRLEKKIISRLKREMIKMQ